MAEIRDGHGREEEDLIERLRDVGPAVRIAVRQEDPAEDIARVGVAVVEPHRRPARGLDPQAGVRAVGEVRRGVGEVGKADE